MDIHNYIECFLNTFNKVKPEHEEVEYIGTYLKNGNLVVQLVSPELQVQWSSSVIPDFYQSLYDMKVGEPSFAGGIFSAAPFAPFDPNDLQYMNMGLPSPSEVLYDFCTDNCGSPYWVNSDLQVFGRNLDNEIQPVGSLENFVKFAIDQVLVGGNWYDSINDAAVTREYDLNACEGFD